MTSLVIRDISWPLVRRLKNAGRLIEDVAEQLVAEVADDALADVGHQVGGEVGAQPLDEVDDQDGDTPRPEVDREAETGMSGPVAEHAVHQRLDQGDEPGRGRGVEQHRRERRDKPPAIGRA